MSDGKKWLEMAARDKMLAKVFCGKMTAALQVTDTHIADKMKANFKAEMKAKFKAEMKAKIKAEMRLVLAEMQAKIAEIAEDRRLVEAAAREEHVILGANPPLRLYAWI